MSAHRPTFLSHAHADNTLCDRYAAALTARGLDVWYDRNNAQVGHLLGNEIQAELQRRPAFVLLLTQHALDSFWVNLETQTYLGLMAKDRSRLLLSVRIGPCDVPPMLNAFLWIDALALGFDAAIDAIAAALTVRDAPSAPPSAPPPPREPTLPARPGPVPAPAGASPYGAQDVAGNVWEWTSSLYKSYPYNQNDGREDRNSTENRALHGGSWKNDSTDAHAAYRGRPPDLLYDSVGFRVALAAPGSAR